MVDSRVFIGLPWPMNAAGMSGMSGASRFLDAAQACVGVTHGVITMQQIRAGISGGH